MNNSISQNKIHHKSSKSINTLNKMQHMKSSFPRQQLKPQSSAFMSPRVSPDRIIRLSDISSSEISHQKSPRYMSPIEPHIHSDYVEPEFYEPYKE
jgi:hypothetical protein